MAEFRRLTFAGSSCHAALVAARCCSLRARRSSALSISGYLLRYLPLRVRVYDLATGRAAGFHSPLLVLVLISGPCRLRCFAGGLQPGLEPLHDLLDHRGRDLVGVLR